jgi:hypothetical protein
MEVAPDFVKEVRIEWLDSAFLNQNLNLSDLPNAATARTNLGFTAQTAGQILYGNGGTTFDSESSLFWDSSNDRLGLSTNSPQDRLHLNDVGANALNAKFTNSVSGATSTDGFDVGIDASANAILRQRENLPLIFYTNNTEAARILSTGDFLLKQSLQLEDPDSGTNVITVRAPTTLAVDYNFILPTTAGSSGNVLTTDGAGNLYWGTSGGTVLTTKGDLFTYDTGNTRLPVGATFGQVLTVDASQTTGLAWGPVIKAGSQAVSASVTSRAVTFTNAMPSTSYGVLCWLCNYTDATPMRQLLSNIVKTTGGFTAEWDNQTNSANYILEWIAIGHTS